MKTLVRACALAGIAATLASCTHAMRPARRHSGPSTALSRYLASNAPLFPANRVVAYYGEAGVPAMGVLAQGSIASVTRRLRAQAKAYALPKRPVIGAFELIAVAAHEAPGLDGEYHGAVDDAAIQRYLAAARAMSGILVIDIQPGRSRFLPLVKRVADVLRQPDVGLALDPEWEMGPNEVPGQTIGGTTAAEVNEVARFVADIVRTNHLPQKLFVIHEFTPEMIANRSAIAALPELAMTYHVDGFGHRPNKLNMYHLLAPSNSRFHVGMKLFYTQDIDIFEPHEVLRLKPAPDLITYQ